MRERFRPDPTWSRAEMEDVQREIAETATFADDFDFDPASVTSPIDTDVALEPDDTPDERTKSPGGGRGSGGSGAPVTPGAVVGVDQAFLDEQAVSAAVAIRDGAVIERVHATAPLEIPYIPGLLAFREGEAVLRAVERLSVVPDLVVVDGSGRIHYREAGLATHVGVTLDVPAVGVAKSLLCGQPTASLDELPVGARVPIEADGAIDSRDGTVVGYACQTRQFDSPHRHVNPLYVSPGHRVGVDTAVDLVEGLCAGYKLPEPTRLADRYADEVKGATTGENGTGTGTGTTN